MASWHLSRRSCESLNDPCRIDASDPGRPEVRRSAFGVREFRAEEVFYTLGVGHAYAQFSRTPFGRQRQKRRDPRRLRIDHLLLSDGVRVKLVLSNEECGCSAYQFSGPKRAGRGRCKSSLSTWRQYHARRSTSRPRSRPVFHARRMGAGGIRPGRVPGGISNHGA